MAFWQVRVWHYNALGRRFDYGKTWLKRLPVVARAINDMKPDVVTLVECGKLEAQELSRMTGYAWSNYLGSTILARKGLKFRKLKTFNWLKGYPHSALVCEVTNEEGYKINVAASHLPPFAYRATLRKTCTKKLSDLFKGWSDATIIGTDANWSKTYESYVKSLGWISARVNASNAFKANYRTSGKVKSSLFKSGNPIDYVIGKAGKKNPIKVLYYTVHDGRAFPGGDHNPLEVIAVCGTPPVIPTKKEKK